MRKTIKLLLIAAVALSVALAAYAGNNPEKSGCKKDAEKTMLCDCFSKLNLTDKQKDEIAAMKKVCMEQKAKHREEMSKMCASIKEMVNSDNPDIAAIDKKIDEQAKLWINGKKAAVDHMLKVKALLTPEQLKLWKEHKASCGSDCKGKDMKKHDCKAGDKGEGCKGVKHEGCDKNTEMIKHDCKGEDHAGCKHSEDNEKTDK